METAILATDMVTDGGGYTFYEVDPNADVYAPEAESDCASHGMQLWIPRSEALLLSARYMCDVGDKLP